MCLTGGLCGTENNGTCQLRILSSTRILESNKRQSRIKMFLFQAASTDRYNIMEFKWATEGRIAINTTVTVFHHSETFKTEKVKERSYSYYIFLTLFPKTKSQSLMKYTLVVFMWCTSYFQVS